MASMNAWGLTVMRLARLAAGTQIADRPWRCQSDG
jgi:hypothetical protein